MPIVHANRFISNLSITLPRQIHQRIKAKFLRSGAPSFAAYVAMVLEAAPERTTATRLLRSHVIEMTMKAFGSGTGNTGGAGS